MITVIVKMTVRPEKRKEFLQTILAMTDPSRKQKGCTSRELLQDTGNEDSFVLLEEWETRAELDRHVRSDWFRVLRGTRDLLCEEPHLKLSLLSHAVPMSSVRPGLGSVNLW
jgi:quinol monooxygenase YgiN